MKCALWVVMVVFMAGFVRVSLDAIVNVDDIDVVLTSDFDRSYDLWELFYETMNNAYDLHTYYKSPEYIKSGKIVSNNDIQNELYNMYIEWNSVNSNYSTTITEGINGVTVQSQSGSGDSVSVNTSTTVAGEYRDSEGEDYTSFEYYLKKNPDAPKEAKKRIIDQKLSDYTRIKKKIDKEKGMIYSLQTKDGNFSNSENTIDLKEFAIYLTHKDDKVIWNKEILNGNIRTSYYRNTDFESTLTVGMKTDYYNELKTKWNEDRKEAVAYARNLAVCMGLILFCFVFLVTVTGRRPNEKDVHLYGIDKVYSEVHFVLAFFVIFFTGAFFVEVGFYYLRIGSLTKFSIVLLTTIAALVLALCLSLVRKLKAHIFLSGFVCYRILRKIVICLWSFCKKCGRAFVRICNGGNLMHKMIALAVVVPLLSATWILTPFVIVGLVYLVYKRCGSFVLICDGVQRVKSGDLNHKIIVNGNGALAQLAEDINTLSTGLNEAVFSELKSERLKTELISNVSHDIKTPLTSIITYVDLLKNEEIDNDKASGYIDVLERKAQRLKVLTSDLFEAAKATSGSMNVEKENVDLISLIKQGLGEFDDKIKACEFDVRVDMPKEAVFIYADGRLMWRVLENLLSNLIKYALKSSRVYLTLTPSEHSIDLVLKNISSYELNLPAEDLMERFKRGDESRNSEGSGLGLSIAKSLVELQGGSFDVVVDGDLFKVTIVMPLSHSL